MLDRNVRATLGKPGNRMRVLVVVESFMSDYPKTSLERLLLVPLLWCDIFCLVYNQGVDMKLVYALK